MSLRGAFHHALLALCLTIGGLASAQEPVSDKRPDVRVVIDVSGSMKLNDPQNLRKPALELLVKLFPDNAKAGVWTFGQWVNMLVPHQPVTDDWREQAMVAAEQINSVALFTNIPEALEKASYDLDQLDPAYRTSIILLTDGMVDVSKSSAENAAARRTIFDDTLPKLRQAGVAVYGIALSENTDRELLERIAADTGGLFAVADTAEKLTAIFLQAFDAAAPAEQLPLEDNRFLVDSSVDEFTALIFRSSAPDVTELVAPDQQRYRAAEDAERVSWYRGEGYDLITVTKPYEGEWSVVADVEDNSRITIVSNLSLAVERLDKSLFGDSEPELAGFLQEQGKVITDPNFLELVTFSATVSRQHDNRQWDIPLSALNPTPGDGVYRAPLPMLAEAGTYEITAVADGKTFQRAQKQTVQVRETFAVDVVSSSDLPPLHTVELYAQNPAVDTAATEVVAELTLPDGGQRVVPVAAGDDRRWTLLLEDLPFTGSYQLSFAVDGRYDSGAAFEYRSEPLTIKHQVPGQAAVAPEPEPEPEPPATTEPQAEPEAQPEPTAATPDVETGESSRWLIYAGLALGNVLIIGLGIVAYRIISKGSRSPALNDEEEDSDEDADEEMPEAAPAEVKAAHVAPPPPVDDIDADLAELEPAAETEPEELDDLGDVDTADVELGEEAADDDEDVTLPDDAIDLEAEDDAEEEEKPRRRDDLD